MYYQEGQMQFTEQEIHERDGDWKKIMDWANDFKERYESCKIQVREHYSSLRWWSGAIGIDLLK